MKVPSFIGGTDEQRSNNISDNKLVNLYPVTNNDGSIAAFYKVDGLKSEGTLSGVPTGAYKASNGRAFYTSGTTLYELTVPGGVYTSTSRGTITTATNYEFSDNGLEMIMVNGTDGWVFTFSDNSLTQLKVVTGTFTVQAATSTDVDATLTKVAHGLTIGGRVILTTTGSLPTYLLPNTAYYVLADGFTADTFKVGLTLTGDTCTISNASPCVVTSAAHGFFAGDKVRFLTTGALPSPLVVGTVYYVMASGLTDDTFKISATPTGGEINTTTTGSGVHSFNPAITIIQTALQTATISTRKTSTCTIANVSTLSIDGNGTPSYVNHATVTKTGHGLGINDKLQFTVSGGTLPAPLSLATDYWIIPADFSLNTFKVSGSLNGAPITLTTAGSGTFSYTTYSNIVVSTEDDHELSIGQGVYLDTTGALPNGLAINTKYIAAAANHGALVSGQVTLTSITTPTQTSALAVTYFGKTTSSFLSEGIYLPANTKVTVHTTDGTMFPGLTSGDTYYVQHVRIFYSSAYWVLYYCLSTYELGETQLEYTWAPYTQSDFYDPNTDGYSTPIYLMETRRLGLATGMSDAYNPTSALATTAATTQSGTQSISKELSRSYGTHTYTSDGYGFPNGAKTVSYMNGRFIACEPNTQNFYVSEVLDGKTWAAINVQTVDSNPDYVTGQIVAHNEIFVFCENSGETYTDSGTTPTPFVRNQTGIFEVGCIAQYTIKEIGGAVIFLGNTKNGNGIVYQMSGLTPVRISTYSIEYQIQAMSDISDARAFTYQKDGHHFYVLTFPTGNKTFVFDASTSMWHEREATVPSTDLPVIGTWTPSATGITNFTVQDMAWNGSVYCAVGITTAGGATTSCYTSPDGLIWTQRTIISGKYSCIAWNGTVFCAIAGYAASNAAATSTDGITWTARTLSSSNEWESIAWNGTVFCAVGASACITSPDGFTWTTRTIQAYSWYAIAWNGTVFCATTNGTSVAATSPDGITWTQRSLPSASSWLDISAKGSLFCTVGYGTTKAAISSDNGVTWTATILPASGNWLAMSSTNDIFCIVNQTSSNNTYFSTDGVNWVLSTISGTTGSWYALANNGSVFCAMDGSTNVLSAVSGSVTLGTVTYSEWPVNKYLYYNNKHLITDSTTSLFSIDSSTYRNGNNPIRIVRSFRAPPSDMKRVAHHSIQVDCEVGIGSGTEPVIALRWSDDAGNTWSTPIERGLGIAGEYSKSVIFRRLGATKGLPRLYELSCDENVKITLLDCYLE